MADNSNTLPTIHRRERRIIILALLVMVLLLIADQISKALIVQNLQLGDRITVIPHFFFITYVVNRGAAWGILQNQGWLLLSVAFIAAALIIFKLRWLTENFTERYFAVFIILSGIIGNSIDRIWRHEVVDFLDFIVLPAFRDGHLQITHWPAFNIADSAICIGVCGYFLSLLLRGDKKETAARNTNRSTTETDQVS